MKKYSLVILLCFVSLIAQAKIVPSKDYVVLAPPHKRAQVNQIEVLEFFSYHCGHCFHVSRKMEVDAKRWPSYAKLQRIQVMWGKPFLGLLRLLATIEKMGKVKALHHRIFIAFLEQGLMLNDPNTALSWVKGQSDINFGQFIQHFNSAAVRKLSNYYAAKTKEYDVDATPMVIVDGRYKVLPAMPDRMVQVTRELIAKAWKEKRR